MPAPITATSQSIVEDSEKLGAGQWHSSREARIRIKAWRIAKCGPKIEISAPPTTIAVVIQDDTPAHRHRPSTRNSMPQSPVISMLMSWNCGVDALSA